jgi:hypothetical protein
VELGCNVDLSHTSGIETAHLQNIGSSVFCVPVFFPFGSDFVSDTAKNLETVQSILRNRTNLKVVNPVVIPGPIEMVDNFVSGYFTDECLQNSTMNFMQLASPVGPTSSPRDKVGIPIFIVLQLEDAAPALHSALVGNAEAVVKRERLPSLFH